MSLPSRNVAFAIIASVVLSFGLSGRPAARAPGCSQRLAASEGGGVKDAEGERSGALTPPADAALRMPDLLQLVGARSARAEEEGARPDHERSGDERRGAHSPENTCGWDSRS
jgi:hypothetical protein